MESVANWVQQALSSDIHGDPTGRAGLLGEFGMTYEWRLNAGTKAAKQRLTELGDTLVLATASEVGTSVHADNWKVELTRIINQWVQSTTAITRLSPRAPVGV